jgi:hypothetical protein
LIARAGVAAVAVVVIAWLAVMERDTRVQSWALAESGRPPISHAYRDFRRARLLNPDSGPDVLLGLLDGVHGQTKSGIARLQAVVRREPENLFAWGQLYKVAQGHDPAVANRAFAQLGRLDPLDFGKAARRRG